jgi:hypothetical protein
MEDLKRVGGNENNIYAIQYIEKTTKYFEDIKESGRIYVPGIAFDHCYNLLKIGTKRALALKAEIENILLLQKETHGDNYCNLIYVAPKRVKKGRK